MHTYKDVRVLWSYVDATWKANKQQLLNRQKCREEHLHFSQPVPFGPFPAPIISFYVYSYNIHESFYPTPYDISCVSSQCKAHTGKSIAITQQSSGEHGSEMLSLWRVLLPTRVVVPKYPSLLLLLELCSKN